MIIFDQFKNTIESYKKFDKLIESLREIDIDIVESPFCDEFWKMSEMVFQTNFDKHGYEAIMWWLLEKNGYNGEVNEMFDENGNIILTDTIEDLWNYVKEFRL